MPFVLSDQTASKVQQLLAITPSGNTGYATGGGVRQVIHVLITSSCPDSQEHYDGTPQAYDTKESTWVNYDSVKVKDPNGKGLRQGDRYIAIRYGVRDDGKNLFITDNCNSCGSPCSSSSSGSSSQGSSSGASSAGSSGSSKSSSSSSSSSSISSSSSVVSSGVSSGISSGGSGGSSGACSGQMLTFVTGISFNQATCTLNVTTSTLCIPSCVTVVTTGGSSGSGGI